MLELCGKLAKLCPRIFAISLLVTFLGLSPESQAQKPRKRKIPTKHLTSLTPLPMHPVEDIWSIHLLPKYFGEEENGLLIFRPGKKVTGVYRIIDDKLRYLKRMKPWAYVGQATTIEMYGERRVVVGYEYRTVDESKKWKQEDAVLVVAFDRELAKSEELFYAKTSAPRINVLKESKSKLWMNYFHEPDFSKGGYFIHAGKGKWKFNRTFAGWKQDSIDIHDGLVVVGSPFSDDAERAKELMLFKNENWLSLPSKRGVGSVKFAQTDSDPDMEIIVSDGIPNTRDKRGRPEIAVIDYDQRTKKFTRKLISKIGRTQREFRSIEPFTYNNKPCVLVTGDLFIDLFCKDQKTNSEATKWSRDRIFKRRDRNSDAKLEAIVLKNHKDDLVFAVLDTDKVMLYRYTPSQKKKAM